MSEVEQMTTSDQRSASGLNADDLTADRCSWFEANHRYLATSLTLVRTHIEQRFGPAGAERLPNCEAARLKLEEAEKVMPAPPALGRLCTLFGLSPFERDILLMCAGVELDSDFAAVLARAQGNAQKPAPTFSLALAALPDAHWNALSPSAPLRYWRLVEAGPGNSITTSPLRIDERILHYLTGVDHPDEKLSGIVERLNADRLNADSFLDQLVPSHRALADQVVDAWRPKMAAGMPPIVQLCGSDQPSRRAIAVAACAMLGIGVNMIPSSAVPLPPVESDTLLRLCEREAILSNSAFLMECDEFDPADAARVAAVSRFAEGMRTGLVLSSPTRIRLRQRAMTVIEVGRPTHEEQRQVWLNSIAAVGGQRSVAGNGHLDGLIAQFDLSPTAIRQICGEAFSDQRSAISSEPSAVSRQPSADLWSACRRHVRPKLDDLAQRIEPAANWDDIVLPSSQVQTLHAIAAQTRQRGRVYQTWGFESKGNRGLGISALFAGASGTGKTMAAEVLANELKLDLYRIDLSAVVSKYIGETEKNLKRVFDTAEEGGAILLFDEADALFGKRSEVKDSHDRYANIEVSYLLQRMEAYRGLAILTTNMKEALDKAFLRRIRFVVQFPFPDAAQRAAIWKRIYPAQTPVEGLDCARLAQLSIAGGNIRNIALHAAFLAADATEAVQMKHLLQAARTEYAKLERTLTATEIGGWG